jgi:SAM-dependent methyltransferase
MNYRLAYAIGFHPWEDLAEHPPFADKLIELVAREENGSGPHGAALDVGTGSGVWAVRLAERGWQVTGIDFVGKALRRAAERARERGADVRLIEGDATALEAAGVGAGYRLILDTGTFHGLTAQGRAAMGHGVGEIAAADATVILDCFAPRRRGPLPRGAGREEIEAAFPGWRIDAVEPADSDPDALARLARFDERFYRLRRRAA